MPDEINIQRILAYIDQQRGDYPLEMLREQLLTVGYTPEDIEAAFARLPAQGAPTTPPEVLISDPPSVQAPAQVEPANPTSDAEAEIKRMVSYLRQHIAQYTIEALRAQLLATGQPLDRVEAAIARVHNEQPVKKRTVWPLGLGIAGINLLILTSLLAVLAGAVNQLTSDSSIGDVVFGLWPLALVGELIGGLMLRSGPRERLGRGLLYGVLFTVVIPIVLFILLAGICLIILAGSPSLFR